MATLGVAAALLLLVVSCSRLFPSDPIDPLGLHLRESGDIEAIWQLCDDRLIREFSLVVSEETDQASVDTPVWQLKFDPAVELDRLVLGDPPADAIEAVRWPDEGLVSEELTYRADVSRVDSDGGWVNGFQYESFRLADLRENSVYFEGRHLTRAAFDDLRECA